MLDNDHRIPLIAQFLQGIDQLIIIPLMQADRRLIEDVDHVNKARAYLRSKADALPFASGKRTGSAVKREVLQPHVHQERDSVPQFLEDISGNGAGAVRELAGKRPQPLMQLADFHGIYLGDGLAVDLETVGLFLKARAVAHRADYLVFDIVYDSGPVHHLGTHPVANAEKLVGTIDEQAHHLVWEGGNGVVQGEIVFAGDGADYFELLVLTHLPERHDSTVGNA